MAASGNARKHRQGECREGARCSGLPGSDDCGGGEFPHHAIFMVVVQDVAAVCAQVERLGGKVLVPPTTSKDGLVFADLHDPAGNHFGVFTPPPA
jgi:predicted enzyme related to lactoylglutathione lyase